MTGKGWAQRYDRDLDDIFAVQDEIATTVSATIAPEIDRAERQAARRRRTKDLNAWEAYQRGMWQIYQKDLPAILAAKPFLEQAIRIDPEFSAAHSGLASALLLEWIHIEPQDRHQQLDQAYDAARRGVAIDDHDAEGHVVLGRILGRRREYHNARDECQKAIDLNPSFANAYYGLGDVLCYLRQFEDALEMLELAARLSPRDPHLSDNLHLQALAFIGLIRYEEAVVAARRALLISNVRFFPYVPLISALGHLGRKEEAHETIEQLHRLKPEFSCKSQGRLFVTIDAFAKHYIDGLRKAGLPEE